jgi:hypothetical protein
MSPGPVTRDRSNDDKPSVSPSRLARRWGVHVNTVYRDIRKGALRAFRMPGGQLAIQADDAERYGTPVVPSPLPPSLPDDVAIWRRTEIAAAAERSGGLCMLCGEPVDLTVQSGRSQPTLDHILPQSKGGGHERENLQLAHRGCNSKKGARV